MTRQALAQIVQRAISDGAFRRKLSTDPASALRGFDLSTDEIAAIRSGDSNRLSALGVDLRMSKAFSLGFGDATVRASDSSDLTASVQGADVTGIDAGSASGALISPDTDVDGAMIDPGFVSTDAGLPGGRLGADLSEGGVGVMKASDLLDAILRFEAANPDPSSAGAAAQRADLAEAIRRFEAANPDPGSAGAAAQRSDLAEAIARFEAANVDAGSGATAQPSDLGEAIARFESANTTPEDGAGGGGGVVAH